MTDDIRRGVLWLHVGWFFAFVALGVWADTQLGIIDGSLSRVPSVLVHPRDTVTVDGVKVTGFRVYP